MRKFYWLNEIEHRIDSTEHLSTQHTYEGEGEVEVEAKGLFRIRIISYR